MNSVSNFNITNNSPVVSTASNVSGTHSSTYIVIFRVT